MINGRIGKGMSEYTCPACGNKQLRAGRFIPVPEERRDYRGQEERLPEICACMVRDEGRDTYSSCRGIMVWTPTAASNDLLGEHFIIDIGEGPQKISSMRELRTIEANSLRKAANGEGAAHIFRGFSQNRSNRDVNTLKGSYLETNKQIPVDRRTKSGQLISARARHKFDGS